LVFLFLAFLLSPSEAAVDAATLDAKNWTWRSAESPALDDQSLNPEFLNTVVSVCILLDDSIVKATVCWLTERLTIIHNPTTTALDNVARLLISRKMEKTKVRASRRL